MGFASSAPGAAASTSGSTRYGICSASAMIVDARTISSYDTTRSITRCRSALDRATIRHSRSPVPVMVCTSSTSGIVARWCGDRIVAAALPDLQRHERHHAETERGRRHLRPVAPDHAARDQLVQPGLGGAAGDAAAAARTPGSRSAARRPAARSAARRDRRWRPDGVTSISMLHDVAVTCDDRGHVHRATAFLVLARSSLCTGHDSRSRHCVTDRSRHSLSI